MRNRSKLLLAFGWIAMCGCASHYYTSRLTTFPSRPFQQVQGLGVENFYALGDRVFSGASPEGDAGFATLQHLGIKTVLSVDGAAPAAEAAARHGLRYVHIPVGYDGISASNALSIIKAARTLPGPLFIHCHHGQHRGPTAAAIVCESLEGWTPQQAEAWLRTVGTSTNYPGLYRTVREFVPPDETVLQSVSVNFTSRAPTPGLVNTMVQVDEHFDLLTAIEKEGFKPLSAHPDATAASESLLLLELFREAHRAKQGAERGQKFLSELARAETAASNLHARLREFEAEPSADTQAAKFALQTLAKNCASCHKTYRN